MENNKRSINLEIFRIDEVAGFTTDNPKYGMYAIEVELRSSSEPSVTRSKNIGVFKTLSDATDVINSIKGLNLNKLDVSDEIVSRVLQSYSRPIGAISTHGSVFDALAELVKLAKFIDHGMRHHGVVG